MNQLNMNNEADFECIEDNDNENNNTAISYLLSPLNDNKSHTLVLDIDETLLSVRRWIDEIQINDKVFYNKRDGELAVIRITKEVTLQYDDGIINVYSFYFNQQQPFGQLSSSLDVGDRMDIGGRLASVKEVLTSYVTIFDGESNKEIEINCLNDDYLQDLQYIDNLHFERNNKFCKADLIYNNMYLVRFRSGLYQFFDKITSYKNLEIILWTAAVRKVYTGLMAKVEQILLNKLNKSNNNKKTLWNDILFRDNCTVRENGSYYKDLSLLGRNMNNLIMIDNISFNFQGFELNGLPIQEYWGHLNDNELNKCCNILDDILADSNDVRCILHRLAFIYDFSTYKLESMLSYLKQNKIENMSMDNDDSMSMDIDDIQPPPTPLFDEDEVIEMNMDFVQSSQSNVDASDGSDSIPTSLESASASAASASNEDSDKHLDFYLFNLSPALMNNGIIDDNDDQHIFNDVDPTLLFNQNYN